MRKVPFVILLIVTIILGIATFYEKNMGSMVAQRNIYASWWMMTLWASIVIVGIYVCYQKLFEQRKPAMLLHTAFCVILFGALVTSFAARRGQMHLREDGQRQSSLNLPFQLSLDDFEIEYYTGTTTPADYISHLSIVDSGDTLKSFVSMNNILKYRGYRFYQASYDEDLKGSILSVSYDPYGIAITYFGYLLLVIAMVWILFDKKGRFRQLLRSLSVVALLFFPMQLDAQRTMTKEEAQIFGELSVYYNGRVVPVDTYAHDFTAKLTGKSSYRGFNAVQVLAGWIFFPDDWQSEPMIEIKDKDVRLYMLEGRSVKRFRLVDFFDENHVYKLQSTNFPEQHKGMREANEKVGLVMAQRNAATLRMFPQGNKWYSCMDHLSGINPDDTLFVSNVFLMIRETLNNENHEMLADLLQKINVYQYRRAEEGSISQIKKKVEIFYNRFNVAGILFKVNLTFGVLAFGLFVRNIVTKKKNTFLSYFFYAQLLVSSLLLTVALGIRWYVSGHVPMSNGYETMMVAAWFVLLITLLLGWRSELIAAAGLLLSGFALLVSSIGSMNPQITQLVPVLMSPWLSIHVSLLMVSYALLAFITFNGITAVILRLTMEEGREYIGKLQVISQVMLYPALFAMVAGIFVGAVWANVSWGRYWGWDPKEVWALITMLIYSFAMHGESIPVFRKPLAFHVLMIFAFFSVLMTYFGVSMFLGGMHSY